MARPKQTSSGEVKKTKPKAGLKAPKGAVAETQEKRSHPVKKGTRAKQKARRWNRGSHAGDVILKYNYTRLIIKKASDNYSSTIGFRMTEGFVREMICLVEHIVQNKLCLFVHTESDHRPLKKRMVTTTANVMALAMDSACHTMSHEVRQLYTLILKHQLP